MLDHWYKQTKTENTSIIEPEQSLPYKIASGLGKDSDALDLWQPTECFARTDQVAWMYRQI